ncbi:MAG: hypothetical protein J6L00_02080 [Clostridia bacterium]|nr:hypothetical protein [Clostridia bacterium]
MCSISPNDAGIMGYNDSESIQNAVNEAKKTGLNKVVIPRLNKRTGVCRWDIDKAIILPSEIHIVLDNCYLRQADGCFDNVFRNCGEEDALDHSADSEMHDIYITGIGNAVIDGGESNGLTEATFREMNIPIRKNNMILLYNVRRFRIEHLTLKNQRWWAINLYFAEQGTLSDLYIEARSTVPNQDGIDLRVGCHDILIENITGQAGDDLIALSALNKRVPQSEKAMSFPYYVDGKDSDIHDIIIRNVIGTSISCAIIAIRNTDSAKIYNVTIDNVFDTQNGVWNNKAPDAPFYLRQTNKKTDGFISPYAVIRIGQGDYFKWRNNTLGEIYGITATNIHAKHNAAIMINSSLDKSYFGNIYAENGVDNIVTTKSDWLHQIFGADIRDTVFENIFFQCTDNKDAVAFHFVEKGKAHTLQNVHIRNAFTGNCPTLILQEYGDAVKFDS